MILRRLTALTLLAAAACAGDRQPTPNADTFADLDFEPVATIVLDDDTTSPARIEIVEEEAVEIVNEGARSRELRGDPPFGTGALEPGESTTLVFPEPGDYDFVADDGTEGRVRVASLAASGGP